MEDYKLYFKVYQDKHNTIVYYVDTQDGILNLCQQCLDDGCLESPVFEPVWMTEEEFDCLEEFTGF